MALRRKARIDRDKAADPDAVRLAAITLLARRDFAAGELRQRLESKGCDPQISADVVAGLVTERVLDDTRYAENYVACHSGRGEGPLRIAADLTALGIPAAVIDAALRDGPDWRALAREVRIRKFGPEPPQNWKEQVRQARFLQFRGFSSDHIRSATGAEFD